MLSEQNLEPLKKEACGAILQNPSIIPEVFAKLQEARGQGDLTSQEWILIVRLMQIGFSEVDRWHQTPRTDGGDQNAIDA